MRDNWIIDHVGNEVQPRSGFEDELAATLQLAWHNRRPIDSRSARVTLFQRRPMKVLAVVGWAAAVVAVVVGVAFVVNDDDQAQVPADSVVTSPVTTSPVVITTPSTEPTTPPSTSTSPSTTVPAAPTASTQAEQAVLDYLTALADGRYDAAAKLLGDGGLELEARADLRPLMNADGTLTDLAAALRGWCEAGAMCQVPIALNTDSNRVIARFSIDGIERSTVFVGGTFEGSQLVQGLPLRLPPPGISIADTILCPTSSVSETMLVDLDGDGWAETLSLQMGAQITLTTCGTTLVIPATVVPSAAGNPGVFAIDIEADGTGELFIVRYTEAGFSGSVWRLVDGSLVDTGVTGELSSPAGDQPGTSFGCDDVDGDGIAEFVNYEYRYVGGTDLSNSSALSYTVRHAGSTIGGTRSLSFTLPAQIDEAFHNIGGYCGPFQVQTG